MSSFSLIPLTSSAVGVTPIDPYQVTNTMLYKALGSGPAALLAQLTTDIPKHIEGIDKRADPFLEKLISLLENLGERWKSETKPDASLLKETFESLRLFADHSNKAQLLYPQIMTATPASASDDVQKEELVKINEAKEKATIKAEELSKGKIIPLKRALQDYINPSISKKTPDKDALELIGGLKQALEEVVHEQRSLLAKVVHTVGSLSMQFIKELWDKISHSKTGEFTINNHPLMQLLAVLGKYQPEAIYLQGDKKKEIIKAVRCLETQCPRFNGICDKMKKSLNEPDVNVQQIHTEVTKFIREKISDFGPKEEIYAQAKRFVEARKNELIERERFQCKQQKEQAKQEAEKTLESRYKEIDQNTYIVGVLLGGESAATKKSKELEETKQSLEASWQQLDTECTKKIGSIENNSFWKEISGEAFCAGRVQNVPDGFFTSLEQDEIVWRVVAYQEQKQDWEKIGREISEGKGQDPKTILVSLQKAIDYLQHFAAIEQGLQKAEIANSKKLIQSHILHWINYAKQQMMHNERDIWKKQAIEHAFDEAILKIRQGSCTSAIQFIQHFIRESDYWKKIWLDIRSPLADMSADLKDFCQISLPVKPPKCAADVWKALGRNETHWEAGLVEQANQKEKAKLTENVLALICFELVAYVMGLKDKRADYERLIQAMDAMKSKTALSSDALKDILKTFLGQEAQQKSVDSLYRVYATHQSTEFFFKPIYLELINVFICEKGGRSSAAWMAWLTVSSVYDLAELFIQPFAERLFKEIDGAVATPTGNLSQKHLAPIQGITKALSTYLIAVTNWADAINEQNRKTSVQAGQTLLGRKEDDLPILLDRADRYDGMTPDQITLKMGYLIVDHIQLPDYTQTIGKLVTKVKNTVLEPYFVSVYAQRPFIAAKWILASPIRVGLFISHYGVKVAMMLVNWVVQQVGKWYLWKSNALGHALDKGLDSMLTNSVGGSILDTILLEQLENLSKELEKGAPPENPQTAAGDEKSKKVIGEALQKLFDVIEIDQYNAPDQVSHREGTGTVAKLKKEGYEQLVQLLATVLVHTSKSLLQKEPVDALFFELFKIANEGLRGGAGIVLTNEQKQSLAQQKNKNVDRLTVEEIKIEGDRIALEAIEKLPKVLAEIREKAINPAIDASIDELAQTPSQILLDYITWIQARLFIPGENGSNRNIIQILQEKLGRMDQATNSDELVREVHLAYGQFMQELVEFQTKLDGNPSPYSSELSELITNQLMPPLKELTGAVMEYIKNPKEIQNCQKALQAMEEKHIHIATRLSSIEEGEKRRVLGTHTGMLGVAQGKVVEAFAPFKNGVKGMAHGLVQWEIGQKLQQLRNISSNKSLVKHLLLWQMRSFLKA